MSDFIKINLKNSCIIVKKDNLQLTEAYGRYYCSSIFTEMSVIAQLMTIGITTESAEEYREKLKIIASSIGAYEITKEEYERLCAELGVV